MFIKTENINTKTYKLSIPTPDHYPLFIEVEKPQYNKESVNNITYNYKKLFKVASAIDWQSIKTIKDPNLAINVLINKIKKCQDKKCQDKLLV